MRAILLALLLLISPAAMGQVPQTNMNSNGQMIFRIANPTHYYMSCFYRDQYNYFTFSVAPRSYSMWYPVYGQYQWGCN